MPLPDLNTETYAILAELQALDPAEGVVIANAMLGAAMCFLTQFGGHAAMAAQLRADADTVASYALQPGETRAPSGALN